MARQDRAGITLTELLVALTVIGIMSAVALVAFAPATHRGAPTRQALLDSALASLRRESLHSGRPAAIVVQDSNGAWAAAALPDGSVIGESTLGGGMGVERLSGAPRQPGGGQHASAPR